MVKIELTDYEKSYLLTWLLNDRSINKVLDRIYIKIRDSEGIAQEN